MPSSVFLKFLVDAAIAQHESKEWLNEAVGKWRVNAIVSDYGFHLDDEWSQVQIDTVIDLCTSAAIAIRAGGDIPRTTIESWTILENHRIFARGHDPVSCNSVARFGMAVVSLLQGTLPNPPPGYRWLYGLDDEVGTIGSS